MKLAIEHLQQSIAQTERVLADGRNALKASQRQAEEHQAAVVLAERKLADLNAAIAELRKPVASERATVVDQIQKTQLTERKQEPLSLKARKT